MPSARAFLARRKSQLSGPLWVNQMLQRTSIGYFRKLFMDCSIAPVIGMGRLTSCCILLVLCRMHMTLAYTTDLCRTLGILLSPIQLFLYLWVFTLTTLSISWMILMLRCCSNVFLWEQVKVDFMGLFEWFIGIHFSWHFRSSRVDFHLNQTGVTANLVEQFCQDSWDPTPTLYRAVA
jgi:hypothetical protein